MMLVAPEYRGRGLGARLLEAAMAALPPELPIRLDATPLGRPLYERHDFVLETSLTRHVRPAVTATAAVATEGHASAACRSSGGRPHRRGHLWRRPLAAARTHPRRGTRVRVARRRCADPVLSRTDRPPVRPDRSDRRDHGPDGDRTRRGGAAQRARPRRGRRRLRRTARNSRPGWVRQASKPSARSIACGGLARLRLTPGGRAPLTEFAILGPEFG